MADDTIQFEGNRFIAWYVGLIGTAYLVLGVYLLLTVSIPKAHTLDGYEKLLGGILFTLAGPAFFYTIAKTRSTRLTITGDMCSVREWYGRQWSFRLVKPVVVQQRLAFGIGAARFIVKAGFPDTALIRCGPSLTYAYVASGVDIDAISQDLNARASG